MLEKTTNSQDDFDLKALSEEYSIMSSEERATGLDAVKSSLAERAKEYVKIQQAIRELSSHLKNLNETSESIISSIRALWLPFCAGVTKCELDLGDGRKLLMNQALNVSAEEKDRAIEWFREHGYEGVMKWDIHHATMKSIATELYNESESPIEIPGLKYTQFQNVKIK
jgi:hypothetical protein